MIFSNENLREEKPHTIVIKSLPGGKGKEETYYYGEALPAIEPINDFSQLRVTKKSSTTDLKRKGSWRSNILNLVNKLYGK
jgi:hypothetical protein